MYFRHAGIRPRVFIDKERRILHPMAARLLADLVLSLHGLFILFVVLGGLAAWRWPRVSWLHLPAAAWAVWVTTSGSICPLTPLENALRRSAGQAGFSGGFIDHYLLGLIYPEGLTRPVQTALGIGVVACIAMAWFARPAAAVEFGEKNAIDVEAIGLYWHFVDIVWIIIFTAVYLLEYL